MLTPELEQLIEFALADGELTDKERAVLTRKAQEAGVDLDEFEMILDAKLHLVKKTSKSLLLHQSLIQNMEKYANAPDAEQP